MGKTKRQGGSAQDWLPLQDLHGGLLFRRDGAVVGGVGVAPFNLSLKSASETRAVIAAVHQAVNALQVPWQILSTYRPVDLDAHLGTLDRLLEDADPRRKPVLRDYIGELHRLATGGEATERRYYVLVVRQGADAPAEHRQHLPQLAQDLMRARGLRAWVLDDAAWRELLFLTFQGHHAAQETVPDGLPRLPPALEEVRGHAAAD
jgi:hypothetical protein